MDDQKQALQVAVEAARVAGDALRAELLRAGGPRGARGHAPIDAEVELLIRHRIRAAFPDDGFRAEEHPEENVEARGTSKLNLSGRRQIVEFAIAQGWVDAARLAIG